MRIASYLPVSVLIWGTANCYDSLPLTERFTDGAASWSKYGTSVVQICQENDLLAVFIRTYGLEHGVRRYELVKNMQPGAIRTFFDQQQNLTVDSLFSACSSG
jgi:hypothetical protein